jgi:hypothetical protein
LVNTRIAIWKEGLEMFQERPFIGVGVGGYLNVVDPIQGERRVAHNVFLSILVELGLIGLFLFLTMIVVLVSSVRFMDRDERLMWVLVFMTYLVGGFFLSWEHTKQTWLVMGLLAARAVPLRAHLKARRADIPNETKEVVARHIERQRWEKTRRLAIDLLLYENHLVDDDETIRFLIRMVDSSEEWDDVTDLATYFETKLGGMLPKRVSDWRELAKEWEEDLRRQLVSDF